jgi:aspartate carbamoyltransferase catalytic subunit
MPLAILPFADRALRSYRSCDKNIDVTITTTLPELTLKDSDLIAIADLSKESLELILRTAQKLEQHPQPDLLKGSILATCFFDPSTRTRLSFEAAMLKGGGSVIGFSDTSSTSVKKGESLSDTIRVIGSYADIIAIRHPKEGSARAAADATPKPVINAGDGANQHPTQTLIDLFSIVKCQGKIDSLHIAIAGDLKFGRTVHSLCQALAHYGSRLYFVSPEALSLPDSAQHELRKKGVKFSFHSSLEEVLPKVDILYMTRIQKERFSMNGEPTLNPCLLKKKHLEKVKPNFRILHPLPRVDEVEGSIDPTPYAYYFQQAAFGIPVRSTLLALMLGRL